MLTQDQQKIALITGANRGIGLETARQLARDHGYTVLIGARDKTRGEDAAAKLSAEGLDVQYLAIDPTDDASVTAAAKEVGSRFGRLDVLINNAGTRSEAELSLPPSQVSVAMFEETYAVNVFGLARVTREFWPLLEQSTAARLVNVSSFVGSLTLQADFEGLLKDVKFISHTSSKAAVNMMTLNYAAQWQHTPHRANAVHPGSVKTTSNPEGELTVEEGAKSSVEMAIIGNDGPNGTFSHLGQPVPW
jgi:NAD(P)-dependent dehydrogenase (short-subunit alcohol dehydrogenase family)